MKIPNHVFRGIVPFKNPFSYSAILGLYHSRSVSNHDHPRFMFEKIIKQGNAFKLFDGMTQEQSVKKLFLIDLFKRMVAIGDPVDVYTTNIVINCFCQLYRTDESFAILGYCFKRAIVPIVSTFNTLIKGLILEERTLEAESLFKMLIEKKVCEPDLVTYNTLINRFCECGVNKKAIDLIRLMDEKGCKPNVITYTTIIDSLCNYGMVDDALKLFDQMVFHKGILPNVGTFRSWVCGLSDFGHPGDAFKLLNKMEEDKRISSDVTTYNTIVAGFCKKGEMEDAEDVLKTMIERGKDPSLVTYRSLIDGYGRFGQITKAKEIFDSLRIRGLTPDVVTYDTLLSGYCMNSDLDDIIRLLKITERGIKPDLITFNTTLDGLFRMKRFTDACKLFYEMHTMHNLIPDGYTYTIVLEGLCDANKVDLALSIFHFMSDNKIEVNLYMYNILIDCASKCGKPNISRFLFNDLTVKGLHPDVGTYTVMISSFFREGLVREAKELFQKMAEMGCRPSSCTYSVLLEGLLKNKEHDTIEIEMLLREMDGHGFSPNYPVLCMLGDLITSKSLQVDDTLHKLISKMWMRASCFP